METESMLVGANWYPFWETLMRHGETPWRPNDKPHSKSGLDVKYRLIKDGLLKRPKTGQLRKGGKEDKRLL